MPSTAIAADCGTAAATPQAGVDAAVAAAGEDTVRLGPGTFTTGITATSASALTTIVGAGQATTTLQLVGTGSAMVSLSGAFALKDLTVRGTSGNGQVVNAQSAQLERVTVERTGAGTGHTLSINGSGIATVGARDVTVNVTATTPGGGYSIYAFQTTLVGVTLNDTADTGYGVFGANMRIFGSRLKTAGSLAVIYAQGTSLIADSALISTQLGADGIYSISGGSDVTTTIRDSTILSLTGSVGAAVASVDFLAGRVVTVVASGIASSGFARLGCAGTGNSVGTEVASISVSHSVATSAAVTACPTTGGITNAGSVTATAGPGLVSAAPQFVDAAAGNYRPLASGNLVDAGDPGVADVLLPTTDFYGAPRLVDGNGDGVARRDAGAAEYQLPVVVVPAASDAGSGSGSGTGAVATPGTGVASQSTIVPTTLPTVLSVTRRGAVEAVDTPGVKALSVLSKAPKRKSAPLLTVLLDKAPATLTVTLERKVGKRYRNRPGSVTIAAKSKTVLLRPTGRWNGKALAPGRYRFTFSAGGSGPRRTITLRVV